MKKKIQGGTFTRNIVVNYYFLKQLRTTYLSIYTYIERKVILILLQRTTLFD